MKALRRPEVIVLLVVVLGGLVVALWPKNKDAKAESAATSWAEVTISRVARTPEGDRTRLRVEFAVRHGEKAPVTPHAPAVRLLDSAGNELTEFFQAGDFPPDLPPNRDSATWAEFWLTEAESSGPLTLDVLGTRTKLPAR